VSSRDTTIQTRHRRSFPEQFAATRISQTAWFARVDQIAPATKFEPLLDVPGDIWLAITASDEPIFMPTGIQNPCVQIAQAVTTWPTTPRRLDPRCAGNILEPGEAAGFILTAVFDLVTVERTGEAADQEFSIGEHSIGGWSYRAIRERGEPQVIAPVRPSAYRAFKDLTDWLRADDSAVTSMVGIGRTTPYTWIRDGREPRASTVRRLYEYHATLESLRRRLGPEAVRQWLELGTPSRRSMLLDGELEALGADVHEVLFRPTRRRLDLSWTPEPPEMVSPSERETPLRSSRRRPLRGRMGRE
jgi:hypothetical protein